MAAFENANNHELQILDDSEEDERENPANEEDGSVEVQLQSNEENQENLEDRELLHRQNHTRSTYTYEEQRIVETASYLRFTYCCWLIYLIPATVALSIGIYIDNSDSCEIPITIWAICQLILQVYAIIVKFFSFFFLPYLGSRPNVEDIYRFRNSFLFRIISFLNKICYVLWIAWFATGVIWTIEIAFNFSACHRGLLFDICLALIVLQSGSILLIFCAFCLSCCYLVIRLLILAVHFMLTGQLPHGLQLTKGASKDLIQSSTIVKTFTESLLDPDNTTCSICLEDYTEGNELRFLPCSKLHHFHIDCVDPWLESNKSCPLCKRKIDEVAEEELPVRDDQDEPEQHSSQSDDSSGVLGPEEQLIATDDEENLVL